MADEKDWLEEARKQVQLDWYKNEFTGDEDEDETIHGPVRYGKHIIKVQELDDSHRAWMAKLELEIAQRMLELTNQILREGLYEQREETDKPDSE